jgi:TM2 domain-containing membrane protein YozV
MFCSSCGAKVDANNTYCPQCGAKQLGFTPGGPSSLAERPLTALSVGSNDAPFGRDLEGRPYSRRQKVVAALLQIFLGWLGAGRFYTGHTGLAVTQIIVSFITCGFGTLWPIVDGVMMLMGKVNDAEGLPLRD